MDIEKELANIEVYYSTHLTITLETVISSIHFWGYRITRMKNDSVKAVKDENRFSLYSFSNKEMPIMNKLDQINHDINNKPETIKKHILKMGIIYFFSLFEAFNREYFKLLFEFKPEIMKSKKKIEYEFLLGFDNYQDLLKSLALREVKDLLRLGIDDLVDEIYKKLKIDIKGDLKRWENLRENYYRRNIIVHNDCKISKDYISKMCLGKQQLGEELKCDIDYVWNCHNNIQDYIAYIDDSVRKKFKLKSLLDSL